MQQSASKRNWRKQLSLFVVLAYLIGLLSPAMIPAAPVLAQPLAPQETVIAEYGFEDGEQGWYGRGATVAATTEAAHSGSQSLKVTGRTASWSGPGINIIDLLEVGATYEISGCIRLTDGMTTTRTNFALNYDYPGVGNPYPWLGSNFATTDSEWACMTGTLDYANQATTLVLYAEAEDPNVSFYIDDVTIVMTSPPPPSAVVVYDFEDGEQGWYGRGATVAATTEAAHSGSQSLKVTGRTASWSGPGINIIDLLEVGATYEISGCIRLTDGMTTTRTNFALNYDYPGVGNPYPWLGSNFATTDSEWACMTGTLDYANQATTLVLYAEAEDPNVSFYIDDVTIVMTSPPPPSAVFVYDFEDGTPQGWYGRGGAGIAVDVVTDTVHTGDYALQVTGRSGDWNGPALNVLNLLEVGATYQISGCIRLAEGLGPFRTNFALEYKIGESSSYPWLGSNSNTTSDAWSCVTGSFKYTTEADSLTLYAECVDTAASFYIDDVIIVMTEPPSTEPPPPIQDIPSVYEFYEDDFLVGAALEPTQLTSDRHVELFTRHFNSLTAENAMKPGSIQPTEGVFNWTGADALADFARANDVAIHGHTLVWHQQAAEWMFKNTAGEWLTPTLENKELVLDRLEDHIVAVVNRYEDVVNVWDVVNEVIDASQDDCLRRSRWYELTGSDYISTAFTIAHREAPTATLILNDYGETNPAKRQCMYDVVKDLQDQGVPVHGIGMQMHINIQNPPISAIDQTIAMFAELGQVHITELDMSIYTNDVDSYDEVPEEILINQGYRYKDIFEVFRNHAADIGSVTFWGLADDHTWLTGHPINRINLPLLFDEDLQAKWAYWGIIDPSELPVLIQTLNVSKATPVVDGMTETLWEMLPWVEIGSTGTMTASFQTRWDDADNLYVIVKVEDPTADPGDKVEVFVDQNNGKTETYEGDDRYYTFPSGTFQMDYVIITDTHGYVLEAKLPLTATLAPGASLGFDVRVTDGSDSSILSWNDPTHSQLTNPSQFGTLMLIDEVKLTTAIMGTPIIDGHADAIWADATEIETDVWVIGTGGATAKVKTMWDENRLYVFAVVSDTILSEASGNAWEEDSIEVFVDQNNVKTTSYEPDDGQYRVNFDGDESFGEGTMTTTLTSKNLIIPPDQTLLMEGAYIIELAITLTHVMPEPGVFIGFDFQVNDDADGNGSRDSVAIWNDPTGASYMNTSRFGVLQFVERPSRVIYLPLVMRVYAP